MGISCIYPYGTDEVDTQELNQLKEDVKLLKTQMSTLSNNTLKNNIRDQQAVGLRITSAPVSNIDVTRKEDFTFTELTRFQGTLNANADSTFSMSTTNLPNGNYEILVRFSVSGVFYSARYPLEYPGARNVTFPTLTFKSGNSSFTLDFKLNNTRQFIVRPSINITNFGIDKKKIFL